MQSISEYAEAITTSVVVLVSESVTMTCRALTVMLFPEGGDGVCSLIIMVVVTVATVAVIV
ncbi:MAG: hypothetical protein ABI686_08840 [Acidobacteriota bacterium]